MDPAGILPDDFQTCNRRLALRSSYIVQAKYAPCLTVLRETHDFLATMRSNYTDEAVVEFDDDFEQTANSEQLYLDGKRQQFWICILAYECFHAQTARRENHHCFNIATMKAIPFVPKELLLPKAHVPTLLYVASFWQDNMCSKSANQCSYENTCGNCNGN